MHPSPAASALRWLLAVLVLALALLTPVSAQAVRGPNNCQRTFTARPGDTVQKLVDRHGISWNFGFTWKQIARYNNIPEPYTLNDGDTICVPLPGARIRPAAHFTLSTYVNGGSIYITTKGFDEDHSFLVRVRSADESNSLVSYAGGYDYQYYDVHDIEGNVSRHNHYQVSFVQAYHYGAWWDVGYLRVWWGDVQRTVLFPLPRQFRGVTPITVCLKEVAGGELLCQTVVNTLK